METTKNELKSWMRLIRHTVADLPRLQACSSWRLLLIWYTTAIIFLAIFWADFLLVKASHRLIAQLIFGAILAVATFLFTPLDASAQHTPLYSIERDMEYTQDMIGKFLCVDVTFWVLSWSTFYTLPLFVVLSCCSFKLFLRYLLDLPSFLDSHIPNTDVP